MKKEYIYPLCVVVDLSSTEHLLQTTVGSNPNLEPPVGPFGPPEAPARKLYV